MKLIFALIVLAILSVVPICANGGNIVGNGIYGKKYSEANDLAKAELQKYLEQITGDSYFLTNDISDASYIIKINQKLKEDGYSIYKENDKIIIEGSNGRGCLYGVYDFLKMLGCKWPLPTSRYETIPKSDKIVWKYGKIISEPVVKRRGFSLGNVVDLEYTKDFIDYSAKNGLNNVFFHGIPYENLIAVKDMLREREMAVIFGGHYLPGMLPRTMFEEHPEYFRFDGEKRNPDYNFCPSSEEAVEYIAEAVKNWSKSYDMLSKEMVFEIWPDDLPHLGWCKCEKCKNYSESDQYLMALNKITSKLGDGYKAKISFLAYHTTKTAPKDIDVENKKITSQMFAPRERCYKHSLDGCKANREFLSYLKKLEKMFSWNDVFEYYCDSVLFRQMSVPIIDVIGKDVEIYYKNHMDSILPLHFGRFSDMAYGINTYVTAKTLWRGKGSKSDINNFCKEMYGDSWQEMKTYLETLSLMAGTCFETCGYDVDSNPDLRSPIIQPFAKTHVKDIRKVLTKENIQKAEQNLNNAYSKATGKEKNRIAEVLPLWDYTKLDMLNMGNTVYVSSIFEEMKTASLSEKKAFYDICKSTCDTVAWIGNKQKEELNKFDCSHGEGDIERYGMAAGLMRLADEILPDGDKQNIYPDKKIMENSFKIL